jgi:hypothetical protein
MRSLFLGRCDPAKSISYLPDVARLELALRHAYHAADAIPVDAQALTALTPEALMGAKLRIAPATQTVTSAYPIHAIYRANTQSDAPKPVMQAEAVLITRARFDPEIHAINTTAAACVSALQKGQSLGQAMATADNTLDLGAILGLFLDQGAVTEIY